MQFHYHFVVIGIEVIHIVRDGDGVGSLAHAVKICVKVKGFYLARSESAKVLKLVVYCCFSHGNYTVGNNSRHILVSRVL